VLSGTIRAVDPTSRSLMLDEVKRITTCTANAYGVDAHISLDEGTPPIVNPPGPVAWAKSAASAIVGAENVVPLGFLNMAAEDFAYYMERIPGCFLRIGAREPGGAAIPAHASTFYAAESSIFVGASVLAECARVSSHALSATS
jgi:metal-dependent amidase/aminoacylase/carboxypeptidase family protein